MLYAALKPFAVALMHPLPPLRMLRSRKVSEPAKTSKPDLPKASRNALVLFQSPEESFMPATCVGYAFSRRSTRPSVIGTWATGGM